MPKVGVRDDDGNVYWVPAPRAPWTFDQVYGEAGYTLVAESEERAAALEPAPEMPQRLRMLAESDRVDDSDDGVTGDDSGKEIRQ